jgi:hypothetical protein
MRKSIVVVLSVAMLVFAADRAAALHDIAYISQTDLKKKCDDNGGTFNSSSDGGYSCGKKCSGPGGYCVVGCGPNSEGQIKCNGSDPARRLPSNKRFWTVEEILNNGIGTAGPPPAGPLESSPGGSPQGPSAPGMTKPTTPPGGKLY